MQLTFLENLEAFTVFTMETLSSNRTVYKLCGHHNNSLPRVPRNLEAEAPALNLIPTTAAASVIEDSQLVEVTCDPGRDNLVRKAIRFRFMNIFSKEWLIIY